MTEEQSNLVRHAQQELKLLGEEPAVVKGYIDMIRIFADMGHSGGSASVFIPTLDRLLRFENLTPLGKIYTTPDEWIDHSGISGSPVWQNCRNCKVFSNDGKSYHNVDQSGPAQTFDDPNDAADVIR